MSMAYQSYITHAEKIINIKKLYYKINLNF